MKKRETILVFVVLLTCILFISFRYFSSAAENRYLKVEVRGEQVVEMPLTQENINKEILIPLKKGEATVRIENGRVRVLQMPKEICPNGICWRTGWIEKPGETIVCLPNEMIVRVEKGK